MEEQPDNYEKNRVNIYILFLLSLFFLVMATISNEKENLILAVMSLVLTFIAMYRKNTIYIPTLFVVMLAVVMTLLQLTKFLEGDNIYLESAANVLLGVFTCIIGLMILLAMLKTDPDFDIKMPFFVSFSAFCIGIALALLIAMATYVSERVSGPDPFTTEHLMMRLMFDMIGSFFTAALFYLNRHNGLFEHTINKFLSNNADTFGIEDRARQQVLDEIRDGESSKLEFKSTLRTNLKTGEKDPRMERAVLKTLVAFLNSKGGTLLIGVSDDGTIQGVDLESFENSKDKFGLHLNNLITSQIGKEFLPFINYSFVDIDGRPIMRVVCQESDRPVFLTEGKTDTFFVRSGPSTIDLHGMDLLYYANHNFGKILKKHNV